MNENWYDLMPSSRCSGKAKSTCRVVPLEERAFSTRIPKPMSLSQRWFAGVSSSGPFQARPASRKIAPPTRNSRYGNQSV